MSTFAPKRLLVATDFSEAAKSALNFADRIANEFGSEIVLLHVASYMIPYGSGFGFPEIVPPNFIAEQDELVKERLSSCALNLATPPERVSNVVAHDNPVEAILRIAEERHVDMIVTGSHGHRPIRHFLLGSVAERVVHRSKLPIATVPALNDSMIRTLLCPVNFSPIAKEAAEKASSLARQLGAELILLHLVEPDVFSSLQTEFDRLTEFLGPRLVNSWATKVLVQRGDPGERVLNYARAHSVDLMVIGAQHRRFVDVTVIGSTAEKLTRFSKCPVLTVARPLTDNVITERAVAGAASS